MLLFLAGKRSLPENGVSGLLSCFYYKLSFELFLTSSILFRRYWLNMNFEI